MERINLDSVIRVPANHTSKGDQPKWEVNGKWYKADHLGYDCIDRVKAKPFSQDFNEQAEAAVSLYGSQLRFDFDRPYVENMIPELDNQFPPDTLSRGRDVLLEQMRRYSVLF